jgi:undecaprenyl diphosphate synthase
VNALMDLFRTQLKEALEDFKAENIRTRFIGNRSPLAPDIRALMAEAEQSTAHKTGMVLNIAINYGGRQELAHAARELAEEVAAGLLKPEEITEDSLNERLYTRGLPDVDMILRPSGEYRLSNFMIWQSAYAEYVFDDILWPDYTPEALDAAFLKYARRGRRFGGI